MSLFDQVSSPYGVGAAPYRPPAPQIAGNQSVLAAISNGQMPLNALVTNYGQKHSASVGRTVMDCISDVDSGVSAGFTQNGGAAHAEANGGAGPGAGQKSQESGVGAGCSDQLPANAPGNLAQSGGLSFNGVTVSGGTPPTVGSPVNYQG